MVNLGFKGVVVPKPNLDKPEPNKFSDSLAKITRKSEIRI